MKKLFKNITFILEFLKYQIETPNIIFFILQQVSISYQIFIGIVDCYIFSSNFIYFFFSCLTLLELSQAKNFNYNLILLIKLFLLLFFNIFYGYDFNILLNISILQVLVATYFNIHSFYLKPFLNFILVPFYSILLIFTFISNNFSMNPIIISSFTFSLFYILSLFFKTIHIDETFCTQKSNYNYIIKKIQNIEISFIFFSLSMLSGLILVNKLSIPHLILYVAYFMFILIKEFKRLLFLKQYANSIFKSINIFLIFIICVCTFYWLSSINLSNETYKELINNSLSIITNIAILNIGTLYILLQLNFNKFGSVVLVKILIKSPILLILVLLPFVFLLSNIYLLDYTNKIDFLPSLLLLLSLTSSILLLAFFKTALESNAILYKLFADIKQEDYASYQKNIIHTSETRIDAILKIAISIIKNNDTATGHSFFYSLACWIKQNIESIKYVDTSYRAKELNKFSDFFQIIISELVSSKNSLMHSYFIKSIQDITFKDVTEKNYKSFQIIYETLFKYLFSAIEYKEENTSYEIYKTIYKNSSRILLNISRVETNDNSLPLEFNKDLNDFENIFTNHVGEIVNKAVHSGCINFLKRITFYQDIFMLEYKDKKSYSFWDGKILEVYKKTRRDIELKNKYLIDMNQYIFYINNDFELFFPYAMHMDLKNEYRNQGLIYKFVIDSVISTYVYIIKNDKIKSDHDFEFFWNQIFSSLKNNDFKEFKILFTMFTFLLNIFLEHQFHKRQPQEFIIRLVWGRLIQIKNYEGRHSPIKKNFKKEIDKKYRLLVSKYKKLKDIEKIEISISWIPKMDIVENYNIENIKKRKRKHPDN